MKFRIKFAEQVVGMFVILALVGLAAILILMGINQRWFSKNYAFRTLFTSANGITKGMGIKFKGFEIGKVTGFDFNRNDQLVYVDVEIYDTYYDQVKPHSVFELASSPLGLGGGMVFYPGANDRPSLEEGELIYSTDVIEGKALVNAGLVNKPRSEDPITGIIGQVEPLLVDVRTTVSSINSILATIDTALSTGGDGEIDKILRNVRTTLVLINSVLEETDRSFPGLLADAGAITANISATTDNIAATTNALRDPTGLIPRLLDAQGSLATIFNDDNTLFNKITDILGVVESTLVEVNEFAGFINGTSPQISGLLETGKEALDEGKDVLEGLSNNPLLSGGITPEKEQATTFESFRDEEF